MREAGAEAVTVVVISPSLLSSPLLSTLLPASTKSPAEVVNCAAARRDWWRQPGGAARAVSDRKRNCVVGVLAEVSVRGISTQEMLLQLHSNFSQLIAQR